MNRSDILQVLDTEITRLQQARILLADAPDVLAETAPLRRGPGRPKGSGDAASKRSKMPAVSKRKMSPEGKARIVTAQEARWSKLHRAAKTSAETAKSLKKQAPRAARKTSAKALARKVVAKKTALPAAETTVG